MSFTPHSRRLDSGHTVSASPSAAIRFTSAASSSDAVAVVDAVDAQHVDRLPDIVGRPLLAGMGDQQEARVARAAEHVLELGRRMAVLR